MRTRTTISRLLAAATGLCLAAPLPAGDQPQWGQALSRNMVSDERGLPETFDPATGRNVKWSVPLGTSSYSTPIIARGKVLIGTNNERPRDPRHQGDRGVLLCLNEADGTLCWQLVVPKLRNVPHPEYCDWPRIGITASATVEGDRVYLVSNRSEVLCLDLHGLANGNDGPFRDEGRHMSPRGRAAMKVAKTDADIIWAFDMPARTGSHPHDGSNGSVLVHGRFVYACTSNGVDHTHRGLPAPEAPNLVVLDKATGRLVARDDGRIGPQIIHSQWCSPSLGVVGGRALVFFGGGDAVCYAYEPVKAASPTTRPAMLRTAWSFHCDPAGRKDRPLDFQDNREEGPSVISGMPVYHDGRVYITAGGDIWHGRREAWIKCIDATKSGDVTKGGEVWSFALSRHCMSTPAVKDGLVYIADCGRQVTCLDAKTGRPCWTHRTRGDYWASPLVADGKVYIGTRRGEFLTFAAGREKKLLSTVKVDRAINATATAANGTLYVASMTRLYAVAKKPAK